MKKTLIALALTALPVASMADVILYGQIKAGVEVTKQKKVDGTTTQIVDYGSRIGFKGHEHLNNNLQAIWQLEQSVNVGGQSTGFGTRDSFIGLKGDFGTVKAGHLSTPVKELNDKLNVWESSEDLSSAAQLNAFKRENDAVKRAVAISYETPNFAGFSAKAYVSPSENNTGFENASSLETNGSRKNKDSAIYGLSGSYNNHNFFADVAGVYVKNGKNNDTHRASNSRKQKGAYQALAQAGYNDGKWLAGVAYQYARHVDNQNYVNGVQQAKNTTSFNADWDVASEVAATVAYNVDNALRLKASAAYGFNIKDQNGAKFLNNGKYYQGIVGADYALSKRTQVNAQVGYLTAGKKEDKVRTGSATVGLKHSF